MRTSISDDDIHRAAALAALPLHADDVLTVRRDLEDMLDALELLAGVDTAGFEPLHPINPCPCRLRDDIARMDLPAEEKVVLPDSLLIRASVLPPLSWRRE